MSGDPLGQRVYSNSATASPPPGDIGGDGHTSHSGSGGSGGQPGGPVRRLRGVSQSLPLSNIRVRLTLWYVLLLALALISFSIVLYLILDGALDSQVDDNLRQASEQALDAVTVSSGTLSVQSVDGESGITPLAERGLLVRLVTRDGQTVESAGLARGMSLPTDTLAEVREGQAHFSEAQAPSDGEPVRLYVACTVRELYPRSYRPSCSITVVVMHNATEHVAVLHRPFSGSSCDWNRTALLNALVRSGSIIVTYIFAHNRSQVGFTYD